MDLYLDAEWYINQKMFLIGYAVAGKQGIRYTGQLYDSSMNKEVLTNLLNSHSGFVYCYGPDIGMLEKAFDMDIRHPYQCINLLKIFRRLCPGRSSYKLADFEIDYGIRREEDKYKRTIFKIWDDWNNPVARLRVLQYNADDVRNLVLLKQKIFKEHNVKDADLLPHVLK